MKRLCFAALSIAAATSWADPSGRKWFLDACPAGRCTLQNGLANENRVCARPAGAPASTPQRCLPEVRFAASIDNSGTFVDRLPGASSIPYATALQTMRVAYERWTLTNSACDPDLDFAFEASPFASPVGKAAVNALDGQNNTIWLSISNWSHSSVTLGLTTATFYPGELVDADMELNAATVGWGAGPTIANTEYDYESVVTHEVGHYIGIAHSANSAAVMFASLGTGEIKRNLAPPDFADVCAVYPGTNGSQGSVCGGMGSACAAGLVCEGLAGSTTRLCVRDCAATGNMCPTGFTCQASTSGFACLPQMGASDTCKFCTSGQSCSTGLCLTYGDGRNFCSIACNPMVPNLCGTGYTCQTTPAGSYCMPPNMGACTSQCTTANAATNCAPGYTCSNGTCVPTGKTGDRCEVSSVCDPCNVCTSDPNDPSVAYCRTCCNSGAPLCTGCSTNTCPGTGMQCLAITNRQERLCLPSGGSATCQPCSAAMPCAGGAQCIAGFCRATCNPTNPGACPACLVSPTTSFCACNAQEISDVGEPCSTAETMLAICRNGLSCIANFCRQRCTLNDPNSCPVGTSCQSSGGQAVCLPSNTGQQCAMCGPNSQCEAGLVCYGGRCYPPCTITLPNQCQTCVQTEPDPPAGSGAGVCACPDQVVGPQARCTLPNIASCQPGTRCVAGVCESKCDPMDPNTCPAGRVCTVQQGANWYCTPDLSGEGGGPATGGGPSGPGGGRAVPTVGGGSAGGMTMVTNMGCNCQTQALPWPLWGLLVMMALVRRTVR
jgi:hypothetical protein